MLDTIKDEILQKGVDGRHIVYINLEDMDFDYIMTASDLNREIESRVADTEKYYVFLGTALFFFEVKAYLELNNREFHEDMIYDYLKWGGFPLRFDFREDASTHRYLTNLYESIVNRDILKRSKGMDKKTFLDISLYILANAGKEFSSIIWIR